MLNDFIYLPLLALVALTLGAIAVVSADAVALQTPQQESRSGADLLSYAVHTCSPQLHELAHRSQAR